MASDVNRVVLIGRTTRDLELKTTNSGTSFCKFSLASNTSVKKGETWEDKPGFFDCIAWGRSAETLHKYVQKGNRLCVEGRVSWSSWEATDGKKQSKVEIHVESFQFLEKKGDGQQSAGAASFDGEPHGVADDIPF
jgi:single-strand DNA-binding protein